MKGFPVAFISTMLFDGEEFPRRQKKQPLIVRAASTFFTTMASTYFWFLKVK